MHNKLSRDATKHFREIAKQIKAARIARGLSQEGFAETLGVSTDMIKAIEQHRRLPSLGLLYKISRRLGITVTIG